MNLKYALNLGEKTPLEKVRPCKRQNSIYRTYLVGSLGCSLMPHGDCRVKGVLIVSSRKHGINKLSKPKNYICTHYCLLIYKAK